MFLGDSADSKFISTPGTQLSWLKAPRKYLAFGNCADAVQRKCRTCSTVTRKKAHKNVHDFWKWSHVHWTMQIKKNLKHFQRLWWDSWIFYDLRMCKTPKARFAAWWNFQHSGLAVHVRKLNGIERKEIKSFEFQVVSRCWESFEHSFRFLERSKFCHYVCWNRWAFWEAFGSNLLLEKFKSDFNFLSLGVMNENVFVRAFLWHLIWKNYIFFKKNPLY